MQEAHRRRQAEKPRSTSTGKGGNLPVTEGSACVRYRLKQNIDILVQPGHTFAVTEQGYEGLLGGRPVFVAYARAGLEPRLRSVYGH